MSDAFPVNPNRSPVFGRISKTDRTLLIHEAEHVCVAAGVFQNANESKHDSENPQKLQMQRVFNDDIFHKKYIW
jgi:hypothetical protein